MLNNGATQHFQKLAHHAMELLAKAEKGRGRAQQAANALTFLRIILKHLTENLNASQLVAFVNEPLQSPGVANGSAGAALQGQLAVILHAKKPCMRAQRWPSPACCHMHFQQEDLLCRRPRASSGAVGARGDERLGCPTADAALSKGRSGHCCQASPISVCAAHGMSCHLMSLYACTEEE